MNGMEAKYTAKHLAKMIKHNRKLEKKNISFYESRINNFDLVDTAMDKFAIAQFLHKETQKMSLEFRAFMIHNAFKKNRQFGSVEQYQLSDTVLQSLKHDNEQYSRYMDRYRRQQKAIKIVQHTMLDNETDKVKFVSWLNNHQNPTDTHINMTQVQQTLVAA